MNKVNRKALSEAMDMISEAIAILEDTNNNNNTLNGEIVMCVIDKVSDADDTILLIHDDEEYKYDNLTEGLQNSEMGMTIEGAIEYLDEATSLVADFAGTFGMQSDLEEAIDSLYEINENIENAICC